MSIRSLTSLVAVVLVIVMATAAFAQEEAEPADDATMAEAAETEEAATTPESAAGDEATAGPAAAPSLVFETTVGFEFAKKMPLTGQAGEVEIRGVEFSLGSAKGGLFGSSDADLQSAVTAHLDCSTTSDTKRKVDFTLEFLDGDGALIDRTRGDASLKSESKIVKINHTTLKYVVPLIKTVRISAVAKGKG